MVFSNGWNNAIQEHPLQWWLLTHRTGIQQPNTVHQVAGACCAVVCVQWNINEEIMVTLDADTLFIHHDHCCNNILHDLCVCTCFISSGWGLGWCSYTVYILWSLDTPDEYAMIWQLYMLHLQWLGVGLSCDVVMLSASYALLLTVPHSNNREGDIDIEMGGIA